MISLTLLVVLVIIIVGGYLVYHFMYKEGFSAAWRAQVNHMNTANAAMTHEPKKLSGEQVVGKTMSRKKGESMGESMSNPLKKQMDDIPFVDTIKKSEPMDYLKKIFNQEGRDGKREDFSNGVDQTLNSFANDPLYQEIDDKDKFDPINSVLPKDLSDTDYLWLNSLSSDVPQTYAVINPRPRGDDILRGEPIKMNINDYDPEKFDIHEGIFNKSNYLTADWVAMAYQGQNGEIRALYENGYPKSAEDLEPGRKDRSMYDTLNTDIEGSK